jgi:glycosyltransferase involved in cell wall biosynthesis
LQAEHAPHPRFAAVQRRPQLTPIRILCVGSFLYWKGADIVMKALDQLKALPFELIWVGAKSQELEDQLRRETSSEIWPRVQFKHDLTPDEVADELAQATLLLHASRADNSPNSVKEAVVAGVPVVATRTGGIPDYVIPGENGFLFESGNVEDCAAKIRLALAHPAFSKGAVDAARLEQTRTYLSSKTMARNFFAAYEVALREDHRKK